VRSSTTPLCAKVAHIKVSVGKPNHARGSLIEIALAMYLANPHPRETMTTTAAMVTSLIVDLMFMAVAR
jgi:hypothetical protein